MVDYRDVVTYVPICMASKAYKKRIFIRKGCTPKEIISLIFVCCECCVLCVVLLHASAAG